MTPEVPLRSCRQPRHPGPDRRTNQHPSPVPPPHRPGSAAARPAGPSFRVSVHVVTFIPTQRPSRRPPPIHPRSTHPAGTPSTKPDSMSVAFYRIFGVERHAH
jgi:hypothetical protein